MRLSTFVLALVAAVILGLGLSPASVGAVAAGLEATEERDDFAGSYVEHGVHVYRFVGEASGVEQQLLDHYGDAARFRIRDATYTLAELRAIQEEIDERSSELRAGGIDIRETGVDVIANRLEVGAFGSLPPVREALAEYGDKVQVVWGEGGYSGPEPDRRLTSVKNHNGIRVRITLEDNHLVAGEPIWLQTKVKNLRDTPVFYATDGCEVSVGIGAQMLEQTWRLGDPADEAAIEADGRDRGYDLEWRLENWSRAGDETIDLRFVPDWAVDRRTLVCDSVGITHRIPPGGVVEQRLRWDGLAGERMAPPPDGMARISGSFTPERIDGPPRQPIEVEIDVPLVGGLEPGYLHPMEAVHAAYADPDFRDLIEPVKVSRGNFEVIRLDTDRDRWIVGACGRFKETRGYWKAAIVDPMSGEVVEIIDGPVGKRCSEGPWKDR